MTETEKRIIGIAKKSHAEACPDAPRYKAVGNSMAVPVMRWIGERIQQVNQIKEQS